MPARGVARGKSYHRVTAELLSPSRQLRIVAGASKAVGAKDNVEGRDAVLNRDQLAQIVEHSGWSLTALSPEYVAAGASLPSYRDLDGNDDSRSLTTLPSVGQPTS